MKYLVTGATGFVGANLVRHLIARGDTVKAVIRKENLCTEGLEMERVKVDLQDIEGLIRASKGCDGIFHVAGTFDPGPQGEALMRSIHVEATKSLLQARETAGVPGFVLCSSSITVGFGSKDQPGNEETTLDADRIYGKKGALRCYYDTKLESERLTVAARGVVVNPDYVLGAWDIKPTSGQLLLTLGKQWVPVYPKGGKCFIDADDCAIGHIYAMERGKAGRRYLLGNINASYQEFMSLCARVVGRSPPMLPVPGLALRVAGRAGSVLQRIDAHRFAGLERHVLLAMQQERYRTGQRSWEELGVPQTPLVESVEKAWRWFQEHKRV